MLLNCLWFFITTKFQRKMPLFTTSYRLWGSIPWGLVTSWPLQYVLLFKVEFKQEHKEVLKTTDPDQGNSRSLSDQSPSLEQWNHQPKWWNTIGSWTFTKIKITITKKLLFQTQTPNEETELPHTVKANAVNSAVSLIFLQQNCCHWLGKQPTHKMPLCFSATMSASSLDL